MTFLYAVGATLAVSTVGALAGFVILAWLAGIVAGGCFYVWAEERS